MRRPYLPHGEWRERHIGPTESQSVPASRKERMSHQQVSIRTRDGECPAHVFTPAGAGPWPAVIFYMDGPGIRPTLFAMGQRLADAGYVVLVPDMFYRAGPHEPLDPKKVFAMSDARA